MVELPVPRTLVCGYCGAGPVDGVARTIAAGPDYLTVTWHAERCPHYAADRILAEEPS
ncbi:hypothetical protein OHA84_04390 [Streptomyces sp. NBC_00513]|uniref:hypothetical protein n=1 Tax=unclassified Streptomyces TaxID=2593676 RepID=UPI00225096BF|nr:hypothetical protein [Streptomyces sp. NBC_00424]MCX5077216.1 hypothetical protein [Streptomyces sp. NBC_00424]WUD39796.1 hypothetical protein OHA84_04390 [Streptomyces sp. NBC_00513]